VLFSLVKIPDKFTVIDLETTGPINEQNYVIDIGIVLVEDGRITRSFQSLVRPPVPIPPSITRLTGLKDEDLTGAPVFSEISDEVESFFKDAVFTAHNAPFDYGFLSMEYIRLGRRFTHPVLCTKDLTHRALPELPKLGLDALMEHFKITADERHRALPDAEITAKVLLELLKIEDIEKHLAAVLVPDQKAAVQMPPQSFFQHLPKSPGVYRFLSQRGEVLYVGASADIHLRALIHYLAQIESKKEEELCGKTRRIEFENTSTYLEALIEEALEIRRLRPKFNLIMKRWYPGSYLWVTNEDFPQLFIENEPSNSPQARSYGPYRSRKFIEKLLEIARTEFNLCDYRVGHMKHPLRHYPGRRHCAGLRTKRCLGACIGELDALTYQGHAERAVQFITIPLKSTPETLESFLKVVKRGKLSQGPNGWKVKRLILRLLKDDSGRDTEAEDPYVIEESGMASDPVKSFLLISGGLFRKSWLVERGISDESIKGEIEEAIQSSHAKDPEEATIERLVIKTYLGEPKTGRRILRPNLLAGKNINP